MVDDSERVERVPGAAHAYEVVVFDLDGVVRHWDPLVMSDAERTAGLPPGALADAVLGDVDLLRRAVTGVVTDEQWRREIGERLRERHGPAGPTAVATWSLSAGEVVPEVLDLVRWARHRARVALLTNATSRLTQDLARLGLVEEFDRVFNSSELGVAKPDALVLDLVSRHMGVDPRRCAFIDDSAKNVEAARGIGMGGHHFVDAARLRQYLHHLPFR